MRDFSFKFTKVNHTEDLSFDSSLEDFYSIGVSGTVRENIQNSLDAKLPDINEPVKVIISLQRVQRKTLPGIDEIFDRIDSLEGKNEYNIGKINELKKYRNYNEVDVLTFEDKNTTGLSGARNGKSGNVEDTFGVFAYEKGFHGSSKNAASEASRGGSHGVGKIANNAASNIYMSYFSNYDENNECFLGGSIHLIDHQFQNQAYRKTGYFTNVEFFDGKEHYIPYRFQDDKAEIFNKKVRGLKTIIPYVREEFKDYRELARAVIDNFFITIINNKLIVKIQAEEREVIISSDSIGNLIEDKEIYPLEEGRNITSYTPLYVETYFIADKQEIEIKSKKNSYYFDLYLQYDETIPRGRLCISRSIGMKIEDYRVKGLYNKPFNAVLIGSEHEDKYLKKLENESHTKLGWDNLRNDEEIVDAKRFLNNLDKKIREIIEEIYLKDLPVAGDIDTSSIINTTIYHIEQYLQKKSKKVRSNIDGGITTSGRGTGGEGSRDKGNGSGKNPTKGKTGRSRGDDNGGRKGKKNYRKNYSTAASNVTRISLPHHELLNIDLTGYKNLKKCNLRLILRDGEGKRVENNVLDLTEQYDRILDKETGDEYKYTQDMIKNISSEKGYIYLKLIYTNNYNKFLKYSYELEVSDDL